MISYIKGKILEVEDNRCVVLVNGIGYELALTKNAFIRVNEGDEVKFHTYMSVRENAMELFGFKNKSELEFFQQLLNVSGIGPRSALGIIDLAPVETLHSAIVKGDLAYLTKVSGIGKKTAEKIVFELQDKLRDIKMSQGKISDDDGDILDALLALGYSAQDSRKAVQTIDPKIKNLEKRIAAALKIMK